MGRVELPPLQKCLCTTYKDTPESHPAVDVNVGELDPRGGKWQSEGSGAGAVTFLAQEVKGEGREWASSQSAWPLWAAAGRISCSL